MAKLHDLTNKTFGNWLVLRRNGSTQNKASVWRCRCLLCGSERDVVGASLYNGLSTKCRSCVPRTTLSKPNRKSRIYHIYTAMKQRCNNSKSKYYSSYSGRGIRVCEEWEKNPDAFISWAFNNGYKDGLSIDRINVDGNYEPYNCRWVSNAVQAGNRRSNVIVRHNGKQMIFSDACRAIGVNHCTVDSYRRRHGVDHQTAFDHYAPV